MLARLGPKKYKTLFSTIYLMRSDVGACVCRRTPRSA